MTKIDIQAAEIRKELKKYWGARKSLAEKLGVSEGTIRRHLMEGSSTSNNIRLKTISVAAELVLELKEEMDEKIDE